MGNDEFKFSLRLRVEHPALLWQAAARLCLADPSLSGDDIEELIGPREDPSISDCLMVLTLSQTLPGCARVDASLEELGAPICGIATGMPAAILKAMRAS